MMMTWKYDREQTRLEDRVPAKRIESPYTPMPVPPADRPQLGPWRVAVVQVEETPRKMLPERNPPVLQWIGKGRLIYLKLLVMMIQFCRPPPPPPTELVR